MHDRVLFAITYSVDLLRTARTAVPSSKGRYATSGSSPSPSSSTLHSALVLHTKSIIRSAYEAAMTLCPAQVRLFAVSHPTYVASFSNLKSPFKPKKASKQKKDLQIDCFGQGPMKCPFPP